jgi:hypothetical protein
MFKGPTRLVPGTELNLTIAHQRSATNRSVQCIKPTASAGQSQYRKCRYGNIKNVLP